ncbi:MAG TPA: hypothetical protein VJ866_20680 [Pyrinomonadaceae bacterium]|nr:hypothetical protein [Pyrinomonadaceae bacterium]
MSRLRPDLSRLKPDFGQFRLALRIMCAVVALGALALVAPFDWRGHFARVPAGGGRGRRP